MYEINSFIAEEENQNIFDFACPECGELLHMTYTDSPEDGYMCTCKCGHDGFISIHIIEAMMD